MERESPDLADLADLCTPWCIRVIVTLGIPRLLVAGPQPVSLLAERTRCDAEVLDLVLGQLAGKGLLRQTPAGCFGLTEAASGLLDESFALMLDLNGIGDRYARMWAGLLSSARTGTSSYHKVIGKPFWTDLEAHPQVQHSYDQINGPAGHKVATMSFDIAGGWERVSTVVQLGGNIGGELAVLLRARPHLRGTLLDLPRAVAKSPEIFAAQGVADRATAVGRSFFEPLPAGADLYLIKGTLRVWPDPVALKLLRRCSEALAPGGRVVLLDDVVADTGERQRNLSDALQTFIVGGRGARKRTLSQFSALAANAGLRVTSADAQESWEFVVECEAANGQPR